MMEQRLIDGEGHVTTSRSSVQRDDTPPSFTCGGAQFSSPLLYVLIATGVVIGFMGQIITLPVYLSTLGNGGSPYFVLWFCSLSFVIIFGVGVAVNIVSRSGNITSAMMSTEWISWMAAVGICDAVNGMMIVYASPLSRVSAPLQALLAQTGVPFTMAMSKIPRGWKRYERVHWIAGGLVVAGAIIGLAPTFQRLADGDLSIATSAWWWPFVYLFGQVPAAGMNVIQERMQSVFTKQQQHEPRSHDRHFSIFYFQFVESFFQLLSISLLFWLDIMPAYGTSPNITEFASNFAFGFHCMGNDSTAALLSDRCQYSAVMLALFVGFYTMSYICGTLATQYMSANIVSFLQVLSPALALIFWYAWPAANTWAGGTPYPLVSMDAICNVIAACIVIIGAYLYGRNEKSSRVSDETDEEWNGEVTELCCPAYYL